MWIIQNKKLHYVQPDNGHWVVLDRATSWEGATSMTGIWTPQFASLFIIQNDRLHKVDPKTGKYQVLKDQFGNERVWDGPTSMCALGESLFIVQNNTLHKVSFDGKWEALGNRGAWGGITAMAATWYPKEQLFIIQNGQLHKVQKDGGYEVLEDQHGNNTAWDGGAIMTAIGNSLYVVQNKCLHCVTQNGEWEVLKDQNQNAQVWDGATSIAAVRSPSVKSLYIIQKDRLHRVTTDGDWTVLKDQNGNAAVWDGPTCAPQSFIPGRYLPDQPGATDVDNKTVRVMIGKQPLFDETRPCLEHLLDTRTSRIEVWVEIKTQQQLANDVVNAIKGCALASAGVALVIAIATDGAAIPAATAAFESAFIACIKASVQGIVIDSVKVDSKTTHSDWSGH